MHCLTRKARRYRRTMAPRYIRQPATRGTFCLTARKPRIRGLPSGAFPLPPLLVLPPLSASIDTCTPPFGQIRIGMAIRLPKRFALPTRAFLCKGLGWHLWGRKVARFIALSPRAGAREGSPASSSGFFRQRRGSFR
jgi:hypothetical protein